MRDGGLGCRYTAEDLAMLEDPLARDRYIEIQRDCIVPLLLDIVEVFRRSKHLLNDEGAMDFLGPMFAAVFDVQKDYTL